MSILAVQFQTFSTAPPSIWAPGLIGRYSQISLRRVTLPNQFVFSLLGVVAYVQTMLRGYALATVIAEELILVAPEQLGIGTLTMSRFSQPCSTRRMKISKKYVNSIPPLTAPTMPVSVQQVREHVRRIFHLTFRPTFTNVA